MICLEDERSVIQKVFEKAHAIKDAEAFLFADRPVQCGPMSTLLKKRTTQTFPLVTMKRYPPIP
jgi:hypothetical protein